MNKQYIKLMLTDDYVPDGWDGWCAFMLFAMAQRKLHSSGLSFEYRHHDRLPYATRSVFEVVKDSDGL